MSKMEEQLKKLEALQGRNVEVVGMKQRADGSAELMCALIKTGAPPEEVEIARQRSVAQWEAWLDASAELTTKIREITNGRA